MTGHPSRVARSRMKRRRRSPTEIGGRAPLQRPRRRTLRCPARRRSVPRQRTPAKPWPRSRRTGSGGNEGLAIGIHVHGPRPTRLPVGLVTGITRHASSPDLARGGRICEPPHVASVASWSIVWFAPTLGARRGRSAVRRIIGPAPSRLRPPRGRGWQRRSARARDDHDRAVRCLREAECEEGARALVQVDVQADPFVARERERDRGRTRSRRDTRIRQPAPL
jgi:hypothetical protein